MDWIEQIVRRAVYEKQQGNITIDDDNLLTALSDKEQPNVWWEIRFKRGFRFILLWAVIIFMFVFLIGSIIFYINDVILFQNELRVNKYGSFVPRKACNSEYALFMFNTSELWANTGIQISKGDRIKIAASGAFHPSIVDIVDAARKNKKPSRQWINFKGQEIPDAKIDKNWIYSEPDARFGSVLYQIRPEYAANQESFDDKKYAPVHQISAKAGRKFRKVRESGILHLCINDVYLTDSVINSKIESLKQKKIRHEALDPEQDLFYIEQKDTITDPAMIRAYFTKHRDIWFDDNLGQIMVVIEIQRRWSILNSHNWYRILESNMIRLFDESNRWYEVIGAVVLSILLVIVFTLFMTFAAGVSTLAILLVLFVLFIVIQLSSDLIAKLTRKRKMRAWFIYGRRFLDHLF